MKEKKFITNLDRFNEESGDFVVDTANTPDMGWETGIQKKSEGEKWIIVEHYEDKKSAEEGQKRWIKFIESKPEEFEWLKAGQKAQTLGWWAEMIKNPQKIAWLKKKLEEEVGV